MNMFKEVDCWSFGSDYSSGNIFWHGSVTYIHFLMELNAYSCWILPQLALSICEVKPWLAHLIHPRCFCDTTCIYNLCSVCVIWIEAFFADMLVPYFLFSLEISELFSIVVSEFCNENSKKLITFELIWCFCKKKQSYIFSTNFGTYLTFFWTGFPPLLLISKFTWGSPRGGKGSPMTS